MTRAGLLLTRAAFRAIAAEPTRRSPSTTTLSLAAEVRAQLSRRGCRKILMVSVVNFSLVLTRCLVNVLLVEAGGSSSLLSDIPYIWPQWTMANTSLVRIYNSEPQKELCKANPDSKCHLAVGRLMGGTSSINAMFYARGNRLVSDACSYDVTVTELSPGLRRMGRERCKELVVSRSVALLSPIGRQL